MDSELISYVPAKSDSEKRIALVTGATGFIGSHLAKKLSQDGWQVHCLIRKNSSLKYFDEEFKNKIYFHRLNSFNENLGEIIKHVRPLVVFHLASLFLSQHKAADIPSLISSNILFGTQLVEAMVENNVFYLVNTGTAWQNYQGNMYSPVCLYAATKKAYTDILKFYQEAMFLKIITLKLFDTYGENDRRQKLMTLLKHVAESGENLEMSPGEQLINIVHVEDVVRAFVLAAEYLVSDSEKYTGEYVVAAEKMYSLREVVALCEKISQRRLNIDWGKRNYRSREVMIPSIIGENLPGWKQMICLEDGIKRMVTAR